ncbi:DeoR/GlpR family DNA-binding transcription regulator [Thalassospira alkalitolerans]|uniref:DeoR/GlpR family DNA-binding transcription regulator n=1 Tax=Thalassospira alkalitolerans TaxID=1293890 RepID=UPI0030EB41C3|tara:strand:+ start:192928 stop:193713 length:786 start_codon:yes stop_codon:yes gene_type:complete
MLPAKRRARIIEFLREEKMASLKELAERLEISVSTIRRDVEYLCNTGHLMRTHGGAMLNISNRKGFEPEAAISSELESAAKRRIGRRAASIIQPGQTVIIDSGTTTLAAAYAMLDRDIPFTAFTNDLSIASIFSQNGIIQTFVAGGSVRSGSSTLLGVPAIRMIEQLRADIAIIGAHSVSLEGLSDTSIELGEVKRAIMSAADFVVLLVDSSKFFSRSFSLFGSLADIGLIITDDRIDPEILKELAQRDIPVETVAEEMAQ